MKMMNIIVKKFGGTSVGSIGKIVNIAKQIKAGKGVDDRIIIVVSAMGKTTDDFIKLAFQITNNPSQRELDMLLTAGERISMSLLSLALQENGLDSISFTGSQSGIITDSAHGNARIKNVNAFRIKDELNKGKIVIVAGFQGVSGEKEVTTLGRGGSDTTAVALASYLGVGKCEIYTDVDGVFTADPRLVHSARKLSCISYDEMLFLAYSGSQVLHPRSVEFASKYKIPVEVKSSFTFEEGTMVQEISNMESPVISAIAHKADLYKYEIQFKGGNSSIAEFLAENNLELFDYDIISTKQINIYLDMNYALKLESILSSFPNFEYKVVLDLASVSLTGIGFSFDLKFLSELIKFLNRNKIEVKEIRNAKIGISLIIDNNNLVTALNLLHTNYIG